MIQTFRQEKVLMIRLLLLVILSFTQLSVAFAGPSVIPHSKLNNSVNIRDTDTGVIRNISDASTVTLLQEMFKRAKKIGDTVSHLKTYSHNIDFSNRWLVDLDTGEIGILKKQVSDVYQLQAEDLKKLKQIIQTSHNNAYESRSVKPLR